MAAEQPATANYGYDHGQHHHELSLRAGPGAVPGEAAHRGSQYLHVVVRGGTAAGLAEDLVSGEGSAILPRAQAVPSALCQLCRFLVEYHPHIYRR